MILRPSLSPSSRLSARRPRHAVTLSLVLVLALVALALPRILTAEDDFEALQAPRLEPDVPNPPVTREDADAADTFENGRWFVPGKRYFTYQPSGGSSNQRIVIENALLLGRALNRTVIVPQLGPHTSMWWNFNKIPLTDLLAFDALLDRERAETIAPVLPLRGITFKRFLAVNENKTATWRRVEWNSLGEKRQRPWTMADVLARFGNERADVLLFAQGTMWEAFEFDKRLAEEAQQAVRAHHALRRAARLAVASRRTVLAPDRYYAVHIRFMDDDGTELREGLLKSSTAFVWRMRKWNTSLPLYVATVPGKRGSPYFRSFKAKFSRTVFGDALERDPGVRELLASIPRRMRETVLGIVEQLVCARAVGFLGTGFSTFSEHIRRMRRWRVLAVDDGPDLSLADTESEARWRAVVTKCDKATWSC